MIFTFSTSYKNISGVITKDIGYVSFQTSQLHCGVITIYNNARTMRDASVVAADVVVSTPTSFICTSVRASSIERFTIVSAVIQANYLMIILLGW